MARGTAGKPASSDVHPDEEPTGIEIGQPVEVTPDPVATTPTAPAPATSSGTRAERRGEQSRTLPPQLGELLELPDGDYRIYSLSRRPGNFTRDEPPEIAIHARLERRTGR